MVLDEILDELFDSGGGIACGEVKTTALAYADDLLLPSPKDQQVLANKCFGVSSLMLENAAAYVLNYFQPINNSTVV